MTSKSLLKICTAAFAGSIIGIAYERFGIHYSTDSYKAFKLQDKGASYYRDLIHSLKLPGVEAKIQQSKHDSLVPLESGGDIKSYDSLPAVFRELPATDPVVSAQNFKLSSQHGLPSTDNLRIFNDFILSYDRRLRAPIWVLEHLTPEKLKGDASRDGVEFEEDKAVHEYFRAKNVDFKHSGYDRGHLAAAANHKSSQANLEQTFFYSNIIPQKPIFNREGWNKLEKYVRWRTNKSKNMFVVSGPLYLPQKARDGNLYVTYRVLGSNHISVPTHLYKVLLYESNNGDYFMEAFLMSNDDVLDRKTKIDNYRLPHDMVNVIERAAGVIFFDQISRNKVKEPQLPTGFKD